MSKKQEQESQSDENKSSEEKDITSQKAPMCGLIMPISDTNGYSIGHWLEVKEMLTETIVELGFNCRLVSEADESGSIQSRIIYNVYNDDIVVCDVSSRNPNVMFELGLRLAFDKPFVIVHDGQLPFAFDINTLEHLQYPADLHFFKIKQFKGKLSQMLKATNRASKDPGYSAFLKNFPNFISKGLTQQEANETQIILNSLNQLTNEVRALKKTEGEKYWISSQDNPYGGSLGFVARNFKVPNEDLISYGTVLPVEDIKETLLEYLRVTDIGFEKLEDKNKREDVINKVINYKKYPGFTQGEIRAFMNKYLLNLYKDSKS